MFTQDVKLQMFRTILGATDEEVIRLAQAASRMVRKMEFERSTTPELSEDHHFMYNLEGAKFTQSIAQQRASDIGKTAAEKEQNLRGLCAMLEIEHYHTMPDTADLPDLNELGIRF